jgi:hypothetical protein
MKQNKGSMNINVASYLNLLLVSIHNSDTIYVFRVCGIMQHIDNSKEQRYCMPNPKDLYSIGLDTIGFDSSSIKA